MIKIIESLGLNSINFVASIEVIQGGKLIELIDFTDSNELKLNPKITTSEKKRRGHQKLTKQQKIFAKFKRTTENKKNLR